MIIKIDISIIVIVLLILALIFAAIYLWWIEPLKIEVKEARELKSSPAQKRNVERYCKNCGFSSYNSVINKYTCINPNPMDFSTTGVYPVNPYGYCAWHQFPEEVFED